MSAPPSQPPEMGPLAWREQVVLAVCCGFGLVMLAAYTTTHWHARGGWIEFDHRPASRTAGHIAPGELPLAEVAHGEDPQSPPAPNATASAEPPVAPGSSALPDSSEPAFVVDVNTAGVVELALLPGIGPVLAERILTYRRQHGPFPDVEALERVEGIGPKKLAALRPMARTSGD